MKRFFLCIFLFLSLFFSSCVHVVQKVITVDNNFENSGTLISETEYFKGHKKESDWLFIMYMNGDNDLQYSVREDFNETETGLSFIRKSNEIAKDDYSFVRVIVLWDGLQKKDSRVFELGSDSKNYLPGKNSYNIQEVNFIEKADNEVNMALHSTLTDFLKWVDEHYESNNKILHVAGHGSGPGVSARAMCNDVTSKFIAMASSEFSTALENAEYGNTKRFNALLLDVCFGANFEDSYEFRSYADYMIASPNFSPGEGFNYESLMKCFTKNITTENLCVSMGKSFYSFYKDYSFIKDYTELKWYEISKKVAKNDFVNVDGEKINWYVGYNGNILIPTISVIKLSEIENCADKIDELAASINDSSDLYKRNLFNHIDDNYKLSLYYAGSVQWLFDIGYFADQVQKSQSSTDVIKTKASNAKSAISDAIVYSWRAGWYNNENVNFYDYNDFDFCGITIGGGIISGKKTLGIPSWYRTSIDFGKRECGWATMMEQWFGVGTNIENKSD